MESVNRKADESRVEKWGLAFVVHSGNDGNNFLAIAASQIFLPKAAILAGIPNSRTLAPSHEP